MKPAFASVEGDPREERGPDRRRSFVLTFIVRYETGEKKKIEIEVDPAFEEIITVNISLNQCYFDPVIPVSWHTNLFHEWKKSRELLSNPEERKARVFFFDDRLNCKLRYFPDLNLRLFQITKPDSFFSVSPTFEPYTFDNGDKSSYFSYEQIGKIVDRINELETERRSFWSLNIDRKLQKIEGLKWLVENSKNKSTEEIRELINEARIIPGMIEGAVSTRTKDLLEDLESASSSFLLSR